MHSTKRKRNEKEQISSKIVIRDFCESEAKKNHGQIAESIVWKKSEKNHKEPPKVKEEVSDLLDEVLEIVKKIDSDTKKNDELSYDSYSDIGLNLFSKFCQFGLKCGHSNFKKVSDLQVNKKITKLLADNKGWVQKFFVRFSNIFLTGSYSSKTVCMLRSGIEFHIDLWGNLTWEGKKLKELYDPLDRGIALIDRSLRAWLENPENWETDIPKGIPESHWWYISKKNKPLLVNRSKLHSSLIITS